MQLLRLLLFPSLAAPPRDTRPVHLRTQPLVGGPSFLKLHVQVAVGETVYDFLPKDPTAMSTTVALFTGNSVAGTVRSRALSTPASPPRWRLLGATKMQQPAVDQFVEQQTTELNLLSNSCWSFASRLVRHVDLMD